jgi:GntR family transcriptional regulator
MRLDLRSRVPAYIQIVQRVQQLSANGRLLPGSQLPTVRELAAQLGLNFNTAARAYRLLHRLGVVSTQRGRGTYVLGKTAASVPARARRQTLEWLADLYVAEARQSHLSGEDIAEMIRQRLAPARGAR